MTAATSDPLGNTISQGYEHLQRAHVAEALVVAQRQALQRTGVRAQFDNATQSWYLRCLLCPATTPSGDMNSSHLWHGVACLVGNR